MEHVKRLNRTLVHAGSILDMYSDTMQLPNGKTEEWDFVSHRKGAACVVPILPDGRILLVTQYRPALERETIELPAGCRDSAEEPTEQCAARELEEETGYSSSKLTRLLSLKTTVAFCDELVDVYLAEDLISVGAQKLDEAESISIHAYELDDLLQQIYSGKIQDGKTVAGILAYAYQSRQDN